MKTLLRIAVGLFGLAIILIGISYQVLRAQNLGVHDSHGSRAVASETRTISPEVTRIESNGAIDVVVYQSDTPTMVVSGEQRLLAGITTVQDGNTLRISTKDVKENNIVIGFHYFRPMKVEIGLPKLEKLAIHGSGDSSLTGFKGASLDMEIDGSGDMTVSGDYQKFTAKLSGSGDLDLHALNSESIDLAIEGSGQVTAGGTTKTLIAKLTGSGDLDAESLSADVVNLDSSSTGDSNVQARKTITVSLTGSGDVSVSGNPSERKIETHGSGDISFD